MRILPYLLFIIPLLLGIWVSIQKQPKPITISYTLGDKIYKLRIAKTPLEWQRGLMFVTKPVDYDGMLFIFPTKEYQTFWNKNTLIDLTVYWLDDNTVTGKEILPSILKSKAIVTVSSREKVNKAIEIIR